MDDQKVEAGLHPLQVVAGHCSSVFRLQIQKKQFCSLAPTPAELSWAADFTPLNLVSSSERGESNSPASKSRS